jgi:hypothetical protein
MSELLKLGRDSSTERDMYLLAVDSPDQISDLALDSPHFGVLLAWNCASESPEVLLRIARKLISLGGVYFCCWGDGCELLHDSIDQVAMEVDARSDPVIMTTWHDDESLREVLWFFINAAFPDDHYTESTRSMVVISVANTDWATESHEALVDPGQFTTSVLDEEPELASDLALH